MFLFITIFSNKQKQNVYSLSTNYGVFFCNHFNLYIKLTVYYIHLKSQGYKVNIGVLGDKEIDFIAEKNGGKIYLQVCYLIPDEKVKQREYGNLQLINDNYPKYVVSLDEFVPSDWNGIKHIQLKDFLSGSWV